MALQGNRVEEEEEECCTKRQGGGQKLEKSRVEKKSVPCSCWMMETHFGDDRG